MPPTLLTTSLLLLALSSAPQTWMSRGFNPYPIVDGRSYTAPNMMLHGDEFAMYYRRIFGPAGSNLQKLSKRNFEGCTPITYYTYLSRDAATSVVALHDNRLEYEFYDQNYIEIYTIRGGHAWITYRSQPLAHIRAWRAARLTPTSRLPHILVIESAPFDDRTSRLLILEAERSTLTNKLAEPLDIHAAHEFDLDGDGVMEIIGLTHPDTPHPLPFHVIKRDHDGSWSPTDDPHLLNKARHALYQRRDALRATQYLYRAKGYEWSPRWWDGMMEGFTMSIVDADTLGDTPPSIEAATPHQGYVAGMLSHEHPCRGFKERRQKTPADWVMLAYCAPRRVAHRLTHVAHPPDDLSDLHLEWWTKHTQQRAALAIIDALARHGTLRHLPALEAARYALKNYPGAATRAQAARERMLAR